MLLTNKVLMFTVVKEVLTLQACKRMEIIFRFSQYVNRSLFVFAEYVNEFGELEAGMPPVVWSSWF
jgi:hypothetical protein